MHLQKRIFLWTQAIILVGLCFFFNYATHYNTGTKHYGNYVHKTIYIDRSFNEQEVVDITQAAISWSIVTNHIADLDVERLPTNAGLDVRGAVVVLKVSPDYPEVILLDGFNDKSTLGYFSDHGAIPYIALISSRIDRDDFRAVALHEMGHALGLRHLTGANNMGTLMYPIITFGSDEITYKDLKQFCKLYHCNVDSLSQN